MPLFSKLRVESAQGLLFWPGGVTACVLGSAGVIGEVDKREGDRATPLGCYPLRRCYYRPDRLDMPVTALPIAPLDREAGWCDAVADPRYNRFVRHPYPASAEHLWREDGLYDVLVTLGHNDAPVRPGAGSAIFLHCWKTDAAGVPKPTLGCVAVSREILVAILKGCGPETLLEIV